MIRLLLSLLERRGGVEASVNSYVEYQLSCAYRDGDAQEILPPWVGGALAADLPLLLS